MNTQTLVLDAIETGVSEAGATLVRDAEYANTGKLYAVRGLDVVGARLSYSFQSDYFRISVVNAGHGPSLAAYGNGGRDSLASAVEKVIAALLGEDGR